MSVVRFGKKSCISSAAIAVLALAASGVQAQSIFDASTTVAVPADTNVMTFTAIGGGGGGGGSDDGNPRSTAGKGGTGGGAASLSGVVQVYPAQSVQIVVAGGGDPGNSNVRHDAPGSGGGVGGSGAGSGGAGGSTFASSNNTAYNGIGGGGGGASSIAVNSNWIRAGGGGGGGGGGNTITGLNGQPTASAWLQTPDCVAAGVGAKGMDVPTTGDGGSAGGNGGTYANAPSTLNRAPSGVDHTTSASGGAVGDSCHTGYVEPGNLTVVSAAGPGSGGVGSIIQSVNPTNAAAAVKGMGGRVTITFDRDANRIPTVTAVTPGNAIGTVTIQTPQTLPPGMQVQNYTVTCTPKDPASGAAPVTQDTTGAQTSIDMPLQNDVTYNCTVQANLIGTTDTALTLKTLVSANSGDVTPKAPGTGPVTPGSATAVPTLSEWALILLSALLGGFAALRMRQSRVDAHHGR